MRHVYILHENDAWVKPITKVLDTAGVPYKLWSLIEGSYDVAETPPEGIFFCKMSASAHTRGHHAAATYADSLLHWLESHGCIVINGLNALRLELSKAAQYAALYAAGIAFPCTKIVSGRNHLLAAAETIGYPVIVKHNRGGKGIGVQLFHEAASLMNHVESSDYVEPVDGISLVQKYIRPPEPFITRLEYIGGKFLYAVRVDTSQGFELCPAEACAVDGAKKPMFEIQKDFFHPIVEAHEKFLRKNKIAVAGIEIIANNKGDVFTYDINVNTNYNPEAEARAGIYGTEVLADFLKQMLQGTTKNLLTVAE